jgi:hypothetical protein
VGYIEYVPGDGPVVYIEHQMNITREQHDELIEVLEDTVEYACDQWMISGETAWAIIECRAIAKQAEIAGLVTSDVA